MLGALLVLVLAATAGATPVSLRDDLAATGVALAGPDVLIARESGDQRTEVIAVPRGGGAARRLLTVQAAAWEYESDDRFSASDRRVARIVEVKDGWHVYSGPPSGPLPLVRRLTAADDWEPLLVDVDADRVLLLEGRTGAVADKGEEAAEQEARAFVLDPVLGAVPISWARPSFLPVAIAGRFAAVVDGRNLAVVDLASGERRARVPTVRSERLSVDLAADGRVVTRLRRGLVTARPGAPARVLPRTRGFAFPRFSGASIAALDHHGRPVLLGAKRMVLGPPTLVRTAFTADAAGVAWIANGCVRYAPGPARTRDDRCPSTEMSLYGIASSPLRGREVQVPLRCVAAPDRVCRGTVIGRLGRRTVARGRFAVAMGQEREIRMVVTRAAVARFRREGYGSLIVDARMSDGRVGVGGQGNSELTIKVDR